MSGLNLVPIRLFQEVFGEFGGELMDPEYRDFRGRILPSNPSAVPQGGAVVRGHRISVGDDEDAGYPLESIS
jgi:hypothetical protein